MVSQERILEIAKECEEIMKQSKLNEENKPKQFSSIEEARAYYNSMPLEEFVKRFRSGE